MHKILCTFRGFVFEQGDNCFDYIYCIKIFGRKGVTDAARYQISPRI